MMFEKGDLRHKLEQHRNKHISEEEILGQVRSILKAEKDKDQKILKRIKSGGSDDSNSFDLDLLQANRVFHLTHIREICICYRLRFLDTKYLKSNLPAEAISEIKKLENEHCTTLKGYRIVAPSKNFRLENADDPMLFVPIGNDYFYLIHKWGKDLHPFRKVMMWPLKNMENLLSFTIFFSLSLTFVLRALFFSQYQATSEFIMLFLFSFKACVGLLVFYGVALGKNFSSGIWNSKYFNA